MESETGSELEMIFAPLSENDLEAIFCVHQAATLAVSRPDLIKPESRDFFRRILGGSGRIIGIVRGSVLVAYGVLQLDLPPSEDARPLLGLAPADRLAKLAGAAVLPRIWGAGLHGALIERRIAEANRLGVPHLYSTSAPGNARSWANLLDAGFSIRGLIEKYGGHLRYLLYRDPSATGLEDRDGIWCGAADIAQQKRLMANGMEGIRWRRREDGGRDLCFRGRI